MPFGGASPWYSDIHRFHRHRAPATWRRLSFRPIPSATCPHESVLPIRSANRTAMSRVPRDGRCGTANPTSPGMSAAMTRRSAGCVTGGRTAVASAQTADRRITDASSCRPASITSVWASALRHHPSRKRLRPARRHTFAGRPIRFPAGLGPAPCLSGRLDHRRYGAAERAGHRGRVTEAQEHVRAAVAEAEEGLKLRARACHLERLVQMRVPDPE